MNLARNICQVLLWLLACSPALAGEAGWRLRLDGIGALKVGMRFDQVNRLLGHRLVRPPPQLLATSGCEMIPFETRRGRDEVWLMFVGDVLKRVDASDGVPSERGIRSGDTEAQVRAAYPSAKVEPHATEEEGHFLTVFSPDGRLAIRFETFRGKVGSLYAGEVEQVRYTEGCS
jgi:hypothetical protein